MNNTAHSPRSKLLLSIDIGTTYSAASWCLLEPKQPPKFGGVLRWPKQAIPDAKVPTVAFYDKDGKAQAFGCEVDDDAFLQKAETQNWRRVEWFAANQFRGNDSTTTAFLTSYANGAIMWDELFPTMELVLSHPNGWEPAQQDRMRKTAIAAGLVNALGGSRVKFVTEAEGGFDFVCDGNRKRRAMADCRELRRSDLRVNKIRSQAHNSSFVIAEVRKPCGQKISDFLTLVLVGGTVDITRYKVITNKPLVQLEESAAPTCYLAGGVLVTQNAKQFFKEQLCDTVWNEDLQIHHIVDNFDKNAKNKFSSSATDSFIFLGGFHTVAEKKIDRGRMKISGEQMARFFELSVREIQDGINLASKDATGQRVASRVILCGGFAGSPYVFSQMEAWGKRKGIHITRPDGPTNKAVVNGALAWALDQTVVSRIAKWHYGTDVQVVYDDENPYHHPYASHKFFDKDGSYYIRKGWDEIVSKGTKLSAKKEYRAPFTAVLSEDTTNFEREEKLYIYRADAPPPFLESPGEAALRPGFELICTVRGDLRKCFQAAPRLSSTSNIPLRKVAFEVCLSLGDTEIKARLRWKEKGRNVYGPAITQVSAE
ncbi:hypothetical protein MKEN_01486600 [Mycena kentingensis (nom. inval.)]|nr:hypothetical protein MKEN_01486600 [Mycena kentingensis (nom. inval.)]